MKKLLFLLFKGFNTILTALPFKIALLLSNFLFVILYYIVGYRKKVVRTNLLNAFPDKLLSDIIKIEQKYYHHLCDTILETVLLDGISEESMKERCTFKNIEVLQNLYKAGKSIIGVVGHYGNWEYLIGLNIITDYQVLGLYKPLHNKYFEKFVYKLRSQFGMVPVPLKNTLKTLINYQKDNIKTLMIIIGDQTPAKSEIKYWTNFLNQETPLYLGIEKVAKKLNQAVVFIHIDKIKKGFYEVEFEELFYDSANTNEYEITQKHLRKLEAIIQEKPELWLWSHKRWKHHKKDFV
ncbi:MAG: hypothetical protein GXO79_12425 [Chlorobi bacterium]|nr:hypothetical protein [Chlorobiota bacterium]